MDLRQRLARLDRSTRPPRAGGGGPDPAADPARTEAVLTGLGLEPRGTDADVVWLRDHPPEPTATPAALAALAGIVPAGAGGTDAAGAPPPQALLFLDTETTGLAGGTGSLAFLVGLGWWEDGGFVVRQYFLEGPGREGPLLDALAGLAARFTHVVTFNGNTFDLPLLRTRALMSRRGDPLGGLESWDLLPVCRRLWGRRLADCRQLTVERDLRGRDRGAGDIDGARIPAAYFRYLHEGEADELEAVLVHNRRDMVGMAEILAAAAERSGLLSRPDTVQARALAWQDAWACGRLCERGRDHDRAAVWMDAAWAAHAGGEGPADGPPPAVFLADAVRILKRRRSWDVVAGILEAGLAWFGDLPWLHREAAILYEHRLGRPERALVHARTLGEARRLERLARKLGGDV